MDKSSAGDWERKRCQEPIIDQPNGFHGASIALAPADSYTFTFDLSLATWDSYNDSYSGGSGTGFWDSFSISVTNLPYDTLQLTNDPLQFPFVWGGTQWGDGVLANISNNELTLTFPGDGENVQYLNLVLDTGNPPEADTLYPSWGTFSLPPMGNLTLEGVAEAEEETIGGIVFYNDNDSNDNDIMDLLDDVGRTEIDVDWALLQADPIALGGTYTLNFTGGVRIWQENGDGTFGYVQSGFQMDATATSLFYVEGFSTDGDEEITLDYTSADGMVTTQADKIKVRSQRVQVEWAKIADQADSDSFNSASGRLAHEKAIDKNQGAYILLNDDDDDYDDNPDSDNTQLLSDQENDLLPIYVKKVPKDTGNGDYSYEVNFSSSLRVWTATEGGKRPFSNEDISFDGGNDELTFYVDATDDASATRTVTLTVTHEPSGRFITQRLYVNIFAIDGPENVPDYSVYEYTVDDFAGREGTTWVDPGFGDMREQDPTPGDNFDKARLFWNESPKIAKARYQATSDYVWARDVNVVKIVLGEGTLDDSEGQNPFLAFTSTVAQAWSGQIGAERALQSTYEITLMEGPTRGNAQERGIEKMLVGYMQLLTPTSYNALYANDHTFAHVMQGNTYVDALSLAGQSTIFPWYDSGDLSSQGIIGRGLLRGKDYLLGQRQIAMSDTPFPYFELRDPHPNRTGALQSAEFDWDFQLIVAVGTLEVGTEDRPLPPGDRYPFFRRAVSEWSFSGTISRTGNNLTDLTLNSAGIEVVAAWAEEQDGTLVFDQEIRRNSVNGVPFKANDVLNNGEGNGIWFEQ